MADPRSPSSRAARVRNLRQRAGIPAFMVEGTDRKIMLGRVCAAWANAQAREERSRAN